MPDHDANGDLEELRRQTSQLNHAILDLLNRRAEVVRELGRVKARLAVGLFSPEREQAMLADLLAHNAGPFPDEGVRRVFKEVFRASLGLMETNQVDGYRVARRPGAADVVVQAGGHTIGGPRPEIIAGPCSVESEEQVERVAAAVASRGVGFLRGGAYKPRTSPYAFQGLGEEGLRMLADAARRHGLATVTEVLDTRTVDQVARYADVIQVGSRNMANYELLKAVASAGRPVLLKRGFAATMEEWIQAAEYLADGGTEQIILCERGIRTFNREVRYTLDVSAVPLARELSRLPVVVDVSHAAGRTDLVIPLARAALAAGAHGIMVEVHPDPAIARSDNQQQLDLDAFQGLMDAIAVFLDAGDRKARDGR